MVVGGQFISPHGLAVDSRGDFYPTDFDALLRFARDDAGKVSGVTLFERGEAVRGTRIDG